jgi:hypothetical protein
MAAVKGPHISMPGRAFWGLVVQKGPWKSTYGDYLRAHEVPGGALGGGIQVGGTGEGKQDSVMTPHQMNGRNPLPEPSEHATQSIVRPGESWFIKKSQPGSRLPSPLKAALTIKPSQDRDYEDISHKKGGEPNVPPPPVQASSFLTETRLLESRERGKLSVLTNQEQTLPSPTMDIDTPGTMMPFQGGVQRTPEKKARFHPYEKKEELESMVKEDKGMFPVKEEKVPPTYKPPVYDQVKETAKASADAVMEGGVQRRLKKKARFHPYEKKELESMVEEEKVAPTVSVKASTDAVMEGGVQRRPKKKARFHPYEKKDMVEEEKVAPTVSAKASTDAVMEGGVQRRPKKKARFDPYEKKEKELKRNPKKQKAKSQFTGRMKKGRLERQPRPSRIAQERRPRPSRITTTNLPPSKQSSTRPEGVRSENKSVPKKDDDLPEPRTRAQIRRARR